METNEKVIKEKEVIHEDHKKNYATKGEALGVGIPALALAGISALTLWNRGGLAPFGGGGGGGYPENVNINTNTNPMAGVGPTPFEAWTKECDDALALTNEIWAMRVATMGEMYQHRGVDVNEKFQLWKSQVDGDFSNYKAIRDLYDNTNDKLNNTAFGLYKNQRDGFDALASRLCCLEKEVAVNTAIRPYQDKLIQCEIEKAFTAGVNYTDRKTCTCIHGIVTLPNTPTVTGFPNACPCNSNFQAAAAG